MGRAIALRVSRRRADDWQESDLVLAGLIKDFGSPADASVAIGGRGEFDGVMTGPFRRARVEGDFIGEDLRAWDTFWGAGSGHVVYEDDYITGQRRDRADGWFGNSRRRPVLARDPA